MRSRLMKQIKDFLNASTMFLPTLEKGNMKPFQDEEINTPSKEAIEPDDKVDGFLDEDFFHKHENDNNSPTDLPETVLLPIHLNIISVKL
jgi:hypothetical protein